MASGVHVGISSTENSQIIRSEFKRLHDCGVATVRWFLFADGRGGFETQAGIPTGPDGFLFHDVETLLELAKAAKLKLCFSLIDYLWMKDPEAKTGLHDHRRVLQFAAGREAFLHCVLIPLFRKFRAHPGIFAWEIANEPEWAIREFNLQPGSKMPLADFRAFAGEIVRAVHEFSALPATLGSARLSWLRAWDDLDLDIYQAHFYPSLESGGTFKLAEQLKKLRLLNKPLWIGELPAQDSSTPDYSLETALNCCRQSGLIGAAVWRWTAPEPKGTDIRFGTPDPDMLLAWTAPTPAQSTSA